MPDFLRPDFIPAELAPWLLPLVATLTLLLGWLLVRVVRARRNKLQRAFREIGFDHIESLIIPSADEGEIQIDRLLLTTRGLLIVDVKDVQGVVFGSDKMQDWTVINDERRYTFSNPQPALYDRIAAVRQIVHGVPVAGRVVFMDGAEFTKGVPERVCGIDELVAEFGEADKNAARSKIEAFMPHWEQVRKASLYAGPR